MKYLWTLILRVLIAALVVLATVYEQKLAANFMRFYIGVVTLVSVVVINQKPTPSQVAAFVGSPVMTKINQVIRRIWLVSLACLLAAYGWYWCATAIVWLILVHEITDSELKKASVVKSTGNATATTIDI